MSKLEPNNYFPIARMAYFVEDFFHYSFHARIRFNLLLLTKHSR